MSTVRLFFAAVLTFVVSLVVFALPVQAQGIRYEVTESTSNHRITGWEHQLTARDPNLSHWHWEPINKSTHNVDVRKIVDPAVASATEPTLKYQPSHYVKPNHVALPVVNHGAAIDGYSHATADLAGKLMKKNNGAPITAQARPVASYSDYARPEFSAVSNAAARANVVGNIIHKAGRHAACNETPKYF